MSDPLNENKPTFTRSFDSKTTHKIQQRQEKIITPGEKISDFQKEVAQERENDRLIKEKERYDCCGVGGGVSHQRQGERRG